MNNLEAGQGVRFNLADAPWIVCDCGSKMFEPGLMFKRVSSIISPTHKEETVPVEVFTCKECGKLPEFVTKKIPGLIQETKEK